MHSFHKCTHLHKTFCVLIMWGLCVKYIERVSVFPCLICWCGFLCSVCCLAHPCQQKMEWPSFFITDRSIFCVYLVSPQLQTALTLPCLHIRPSSQSVDPASQTPAVAWSNSRCQKRRYHLQQCNTQKKPWETASLNQVNLFSCTY